MNRADSRRCSPRCLAEGHSLRLLSQFRCHKGGSRRLRRWKQPSSTSKEAAEQRPLPCALSQPAAAAKGSPAPLPDMGNPCRGGQPGRGWHPDPHHGSRGRAGGRLWGASQSPLLSALYLPRAQGGCLWQIILLCQGKQKIAHYTFRPGASYTNPSSLSLITPKLQFWQRAKKKNIDTTATNVVLYHLYLSLPPISRELFPPNGFGRAFYDLVWMMSLLLKD